MCKSLEKEYNRFFYATVCHVCKQYGEKIVLKTCSGCKLISYCGKDHQKLHWPQHKDLCQAVKYMRKTYPSEFSMCHQGKKATMQLVHLKMRVALRLERKLLPYEVQMFLYPRLCLVCQKQNCQLTDCPACMSVSFCQDHNDNHDHHEKPVCNLLKVTFDAYLSLSTISKPVCVDYMHHISEKKTFSNMKEFLIIYGDVIKTTLKPPYKLFDMEQSSHFTSPLTIIQGMRVLDYTPQKKSLVVHVMAGNTTEMWCLPCWEIILHLVPDIKCLKLVLIGPEQVNYRYKLKLCHNCRKHKKKLPVEWLDKLYEDYVEDATFNKPDLIVGFCPGFRKFETNEETNEKNWLPFIQTLAKQNCPLILTCYSKTEATLDIEYINSTLGNNISYLCCEKNPFSGRRPYRESDDKAQYPVYFENYFLVVYKSLCPQ